jgi:hypothetical protein
MSRSPQNGDKTRVTTFKDVLYRVHIRALLTLFYIEIRLIHLMYINTALFTLKHSDMFRASRPNPQEVLIRFVSRVNKIRDTYFVDPAHKIYRYPLMMDP